MKGEGNGQKSKPFLVRLSGRTRDELKQQHLEAAQAGKGQQFLSALRQIIQRLRTDPLTFGEPQYRLPALKLLVRHGAVSPIVVVYAVHESHPLVFIRGFKILS